jgi:acetyl-CoA C-acetyltransferase
VQFSQFTGRRDDRQEVRHDREELDAYALESHQRAIAATKAGAFAKEIVPVKVRMNDGTETGEMHTADEGIRYDATLEGIRRQAAAGRRRLTAASASQICDGAAGLMVVNERGLKRWACSRWPACTT